MNAIKQDVEEKGEEAGKRQKITHLSFAINSSSNNMEKSLLSFSKDHPLFNCFVKLPYSLLAKASTYNPAIIKVKVEGGEDGEREEGEGTTLHLCWGGQCLDDIDSNHLEINFEYGIALGLKDNSHVSYGFVEDRIPITKQVLLQPLCDSSWEFAASQCTRIHSIFIYPLFYRMRIASSWKRRKFHQMSISLLLMTPYFQNHVAMSIGGN